MLASIVTPNNKTIFNHTMLSGLQVRLLANALRWLVYLTGTTLVLLVCCIACFNYMGRNEKALSALRLQRSREVDRDTLALSALKDVITVEALTSAPEKYNNQYVQVEGYLNLEFEGDAIYWRQVDYEANEYRCGLAVVFADSLLETKSVTDYNKRNVVIRGIFRAERSAYPGYIYGINSLKAL